MRCIIFAVLSALLAGCAGLNQSARTLLTSANSQLDDAKKVDAPNLAKAEFESALSMLADAESAMLSKDNDKACSLAKQAYDRARLASALARQAKAENEAARLEAELRKLEEEANRIRLERQSVENDLNQLIRESE